jgi:hypothetical protein
MVERSCRSVRSAIRVSCLPRRYRFAVLAVTSATVVVCVAPAAGYLQRTVNGPASVVPGHAYTFYVSGFSPGEEIYPTVQPVSCASRSERCVQDPCPSCASTRIGPSGTATVRLDWPKRSFYVFANMFFGHYKWRPGSRALVRINLVGARVPRGCQRMPSTTANPRAGSVVCAATLTRIG